MYEDREATPLVREEAFNLLEKLPFKSLTQYHYQMSSKDFEIWTQGQKLRVPYQDSRKLPEYLFLNVWVSSKNRCKALIQGGNSEQRYGYAFLLYMHFKVKIGFAKMINEFLIVQKRQGQVSDKAEVKALQDGSHNAQEPQEVTEQSNHLESPKRSDSRYCALM